MIFFHLGEMDFMVTFSAICLKCTCITMCFSFSVHFEDRGIFDIKGLDLGLHVDPYKLQIPEATMKLGSLIGGDHAVGYISTYYHVLSPPTL
jgi:hypothetical protein